MHDGRLSESPVPEARSAISTLWTTVNAMNAILSWNRLISLHPNDLVLKGMSALVSNAYPKSTATLCEEEITSRLTNGGRNLAGVGVNAFLALVPVAVKTTIDFTISAGGPAIKALVDSQDAVIRSFISDNALKYIDSIIVGLEDIKPPAA
jgi:hypothetical protein